MQQQMITPNQTLEIYQFLKANDEGMGKWPADTKAELILGAILVQNTNWRNVEKSLANLKQATNFIPDKILKLSDEELQTLIQPSGFYKNKSRSIQETLQWFHDQDWQFDQIAEKHGNRLRKELLKLHGIGQETADVLLVFVFEQVEFIADTYARRLFGYLFDTEFKDYRALKRVVQIPKEMTAEDAKDFHGLIDRFGKHHKSSEDFEASIFKDFKFSN